MPFVATLASHEGTAIGAGLVGMMGFLGFALVLASFMGTALYGESGAAFRFREFFRRIGAAIGDYALNLVFLFLGSLAVSIAGAVLAVALMFPLHLMAWFRDGPDVPLALPEPAELAPPMPLE